MFSIKKIFICGRSIEIEVMNYKAKRKGKRVYELLDRLLDYWITCSLNIVCYLLTNNINTIVN